MEINKVSPLTLAFLGDAVYSLMVREHVVNKGNARPNTLHRRSAGLENAAAQAEAVEKLLPLLSEEEAEVLKRGRNANPKTKAQHQTMADYRKATGLEALMGWLYLQGRKDRIRELMDRIIEENENGT